MAANELRMTVTLDDAIPEVVRVVEASIRLFDCLCEFDDDPDCYGAYQEAWSDAVRDLKHARATGAMGETR